MRKENAEVEIIEKADGRMFGFCAMVNVWDREEGRDKPELIIDFYKVMSLWSSIGADEGDAFAAAIGGYAAKPSEEALTEVKEKSPFYVS